MSAWPSVAHILIDGEVRGLEPPAERTTIGDDDIGDQVDRATAPRRTRTLRWWLASDADAETWLAWAVTLPHLWFELPPPDHPDAGKTVRVIDGIAGITLTARIHPDQRRDWLGEATVERPA